MKRHGLRTALCLLLAGTVLAAFVAVAADVGTQGDPLVTLSYLNDTFLGQILEKVDEKLAARDEELRRELEGEIAQRERELLLQTGGGSPAGGLAVTYTAVDILDGETLWGVVGTEIILRSGSAACVTEGGGMPGLTDVTSGSSLAGGGALVKDHLYMMTADRGVKASGQVTVLVRGEYTVG